MRLYFEIVRKVSMASYQNSFTAQTIVLLFLLLTGILPVLATSSCTARPCKQGDITSITCEFDTDVKEKLRDFNVIHRVNKTEKTVLVCNWLRPNPNLDCFTANGFLLDKEHISSTLTVYIPNAKEEFAGLYCCELVPSDQPPQTCTLEIVEDAQDNPEETGSISLFTALWELKTKVIVGGALIVLLLIVISILLFWLFCYFRRRDTMLRQDFRAAYRETAGTSDEYVSLNAIPRSYNHNSTTATGHYAAYIETADNSDEHELLNETQIPNSTGSTATGHYAPDHSTVGRRITGPINTEFLTVSTVSTQTTDTSYEDGSLNESPIPYSNHSSRATSQKQSVRKRTSSAGPGFPNEKATVKLNGIQEEQNEPVGNPFDITEHHI